jgi:hypothetical protein
MYLGRCFLVDEHEVGVLWAKYNSAAQTPFQKYHALVSVVSGEMFSNWKGARMRAGASPF